MNPWVLCKATSHYYTIYELTRSPNKYWKASLFEFPFLLRFSTSEGKIPLVVLALALHRWDLGDQILQAGSSRIWRLLVEPYVWWCRNHSRNNRPCGFVQGTTELLEVGSPMLSNILARSVKVLKSIRGGHRGTHPRNDQVCGKLCYDLMQRSSNEVRGGLPEKIFMTMSPCVSKYFGRIIW